MWSQILKFLKEHIKKNIDLNFFRNGKIFGIRRIILSVFSLLGFIIFCNIKLFLLYLYCRLLVLDLIKNIKKYLFDVELIFR